MKARLAAALSGALLIASCVDIRTVAEHGGSSGVDNPEITLTFVDAGGKAQRVTGELSVYAADQNPAVDATPLITRPLKDHASTRLDGDTFENLMAAGDSAVTRFNLILETRNHTGSFTMGFMYDSVAKAFKRIDRAEPLEDVDVPIKPLVTYAAKVYREPIHGETGRVFIPGSPFLAALADSAFVLEDIPEGFFPLRLLAADGKIYPVPETLDTKDSTLLFKPQTTPVDAIGTGGKDSIAPFTVFAGKTQDTFVEVPNFLEGSISGTTAKDPRLTLLWRLIADPADTAALKAEILSPSRFHTEVRYGEAGIYRFELAATLGVRRETDTVTVSVRHIPFPEPVVLKPRPGDTLAAGKPFDIQWDMAEKGPVTIQVSVDGGTVWKDIAKTYKSDAPYFTWVPAEELGASDRCLLRITSDADPTLHARMEGPFTLSQ